MANLAGDCVEYRDILISKRIDEILTNLLFSDCEISSEIISVASWTFHNLTRYDHIPIRLTTAIMPVLKKILKYGSENAIIHTLHSLFYISKEDEFHIQILMNSKILNRVFIYLNSTIVKEQLAAIKICGNILSGDSNHTQTLLNLRILDYFQNLVSAENSEIRKETY